MAHLLFIKAETARAGQDIDDFVLAYDYEPTATEKKIFQHVPAPNVTAEEVTNSLEKQKDPDKEYSKFPFTKKDLTATDIEDIESPAVDKTETLKKIDKMKLKKPTADKVAAIK